MIRKIFVRTKALLRGISYAVKLAYLQERAIRILKKRTLSSNWNPWVELITLHTPMGYCDAFEIYNFYCLHVVSTRKAAKVFTNLIMDMASRGFGVSDIKLCIYIAHKAAQKEACVVVMSKAVKRKV